MWSVQGWYQKDGKQTGSFVGSDVRYADGVLTFTHKYVKKPPTPGANNVPAKMKIGGTDSLSYTWGKDYSKGPRTLTRAAGPKPPEPTVEPTHQMPPKK